MPIYPTVPLTNSIPANLRYAQPVQYAPQPIQYVTQPVLTKSVVAQPIVQQPVIAAPQQATIKGESRVEYREFQRPVVEMETETIQVQVPKTKYVTEYYPVEYQTEYIPRTVYVPVTKIVPRIEYDAVEREVVSQQYQPVQTVPVQTVAVQPVAQYVAQRVQPLTYSISRPVAQTPVYHQPVVAPGLTFSGVRPAYAPTYPRAPVYGQPQQTVKPQQVPNPSNKPQ